MCDYSLYSCLTSAVNTCIPYLSYTAAIQPLGIFANDAETLLSHNTTIMPGCVTTVKQ